MAIISVNEFGDQDGGGGPLLFVIDHDPFNVATDAPLGSFLIGVDGVWYRKLDDGSSTNVEAVVGGGGPTLGSTWRFSTTTADADPGSGTFRLNNATQPSATFAYISDNSRNGLDASGILLALKSGDRIYIQDEGDADAFHLFTVTGAPTDATTYVKVPISNIDSGGTALVNNRECGLVVIFSGGASTTHAATHIKDGSDEVDGDQLDIDFTPTNYTPSTAPAEATDLDHLAAHLAGIDDQLVDPGTLFFDGYNTATTALNSSAFPGAVAIPLNTERVKDSIYTHGAASASVTVTETATYLVEYTFSTQLVAGASSDSEAALMLDTGGGFAEVAGTGAANHNSSSTASGINTAGGKATLSLTSGDILQVQGRIQDGTGSISTFPDGSSLRLTRLALATTTTNTDSDAIHDNVSGEILAVTEKVAPVAADVLLIEDSEAGDTKKRVEIGNLPGGYTHPNHTGDVTSVGDGAQTIVDEAVTLAKMAHIATASILGRATAATGDVEVLTATQVRTLINVEDGATADQTAAEVVFTPNGDIAATDVQAAIVEVRDDTDTKLGGKASTTHAATHIKDGSDEVDGDQVDIDFTPSNYTPSIAPAEATDLDHLSAHLAGIDDALVVNTERFSGYDSVGGTDITAGWTDVPLGTELEKTSGIVHVAAEVTINTTGAYLIVGNVTVDQSSGSDRSQGQMRLVLDTGGGYNLLVGTLRSIYSRNSVAGEGSGSFTIIETFTAGDKIKLQAQRSVGSGPMELLIAASSLSLTTTAGQGAAGPQGAPGAGSSISFANSGVDIANTPHDTLNLVPAGGAAYLALADGGLGEADLTFSQIVVGDLADQAVSLAKMVDLSADTIIGRANGAGTGVPTALTAAQVRTIINVADNANNYSHPNHTGDVTSTGDGATVIADEAVTLAKMAHIATGSMLGRLTAATGDVEVLTPVQAREVMEVALAKHWFFADQLMSPGAAGWAVSNIAGLGGDTNDDELQVRLFDDTTEEGIGIPIHIPAGCTSLRFRFITRAEATPAGAVSAVPKVYALEIPDNLVTPAWDSGTVMTALDYTTNEFWQVDEQTITLATLGYSADTTYWLEITRAPADIGDDLVSDLALLAVGVECI